MPLPRNTRRSTVALLSALALSSACREKPATPVADSALAQDLAMAQRNVVAPSVFNDAPVGAPAPASRAPAAATKSPEPPRVNTPTPRPTPRTQAPPMRVARSPRPSPQQPVARDPQPSPSPAEAPAPAAGVIGSGSRIGMTSNSRVCAANVLVGDKFSATVNSATMGTNGAMIPAGATVVLEVSAVDRADPIEASHIEFRVRQIDVNGSPRAAAGEVATLGTMERVTSSSGNDRNKVIGGAVAGAVLGRIFGKSTKATVIGGAAGAAAGAAAAHASQTTDACLPEGTPMRLTLSRDIVVAKGEI